MRPLLIIIAVAVVLVCVYLIGRTFARAGRWVVDKHRVRHNEATPWKVDDLDLPDGSTQVRLVKPGDWDKNIGDPVSASLPHWEFQEVLTERRLEAQDKADTLNRRITR